MMRRLTTVALLVGCIVAWGTGAVEAAPKRRKIDNNPNFTFNHNDMIKVKGCILEIVQEVEFTSPENGIKEFTKGNRVTTVSLSKAKISTYDTVFRMDCPSSTNCIKGVTKVYKTDQLIESDSEVEKLIVQPKDVGSFKKLIKLADICRLKAQENQQREQAEAARREREDAPRQQHNAMCESNYQNCLATCETISPNNYQHYQCKDRCEKGRNSCVRY